MNILLSKSSIVVVVLISLSLLVGFISYISLVIYFRKHPEKVKKIKSLYKNEKKLNSNNTIQNSFVIIKTQLNNYRIELYDKEGNVLLFSNYYHSKYQAIDIIKRVISDITCAQFIKEKTINSDQFYIIKLDDKTVLYSREFVFSPNNNDIEIIKKGIQDASNLDVTIKGIEPVSKKVKSSVILSPKINKIDGMYYLSFSKDKIDILKTISTKHKNELQSTKIYLSKPSTILLFEAIRLGDKYLLSLLNKDKNIIMFGKYDTDPDKLINSISLLEKKI